MHDLLLLANDPGAWQDDGVGEDDGVLESWEAYTDALARGRPGLRRGAAPGVRGPRQARAATVGLRATRAR